MKRMKRVIATATLLLLLSADSIRAELEGSIAVGEEGLHVLYEYDNDQYLIQVDPTDGTVTGYWDADRLSDRYLIGTFPDGVMFRSMYDRLYRYKLPSTHGEELELVWEIIADGLDRLFTNELLYRARRGNVIEVYSLDSGEQLEQFPVNADRFWGFSDAGFYGTSDGGDELAYFDLSGEQRWSVDLERVSFDLVFPIEGYVLLANKQTHELFCIDDEGVKLWRQEYPWKYVPFETTGHYDDRLTVMRAGDTAVFAHMDAASFISLESGEIVAATAPGFSRVPAAMSGSVLIKISAIENYRRYGGPGDAIELFDLSNLSIAHLVLTPEPIIDDPRPAPAVDPDGETLYLPLLEDRIIGINVADGSIALDATIELFADDEEGSW